MSELKPCPFCGGEARLVYALDEGTKQITYTVMCMSCNTAIFHPRMSVFEWDAYDSEAEAAAAWNTRYVETCRLNELDALTQTLSMANWCAWSECSECGCLTPDDSTYCINCGRKVER